PESEYQAITLLGAASPFGEPLNWRIVPITKRTTYKTPPSAAQRSSPRVDLSTAADIGVRFLTQRRTPRKYELEELLELHRRAHVALDLELAGHVGARRVALTGD